MPLCRRTFLKQTVAAGALAAGFPAIVSARSPGSKLNLAIIGAGGRGASNLESVSEENIVALCDVNATYLARAAEKFPNARTYRDFRRLYEDASDIDAVVVSTTEHTHAFATLPALKLGKHVYCEKPLTHDVFEARLITEAARKAGVATQMGTQIHAGDNYRRVVELVQAGAVGGIREVHVWVSRAWGWQSDEEAVAHKDIVSVRERPAEAQPAPADVDWDLWIGPAPYRPFNEVYLPGPKWYRWWDFGNGTMSDLGSHWIDLPFWALDLDAPLTIEADGPPAHPEIAPASMTATYTYAARGEMPPVELTWYQGVMKPKIWTEKGIPQWNNGVLFIGDKGMLLADYSKHVLLPEEKYVDFVRPAESIPKSLGHHAEWLHACKTGAPTTCHFGYAGPLTEANHLGNVAYRAGKKLDWDSRNMKVRNTADADPFLRREYRAGWSLDA